METGYGCCNSGLSSQHPPVPPAAIPLPSMDFILAFQFFEECTIRGNNGLTCLHQTFVLKSITIRRGGGGIVPRQAKKNITLVPSRTQVLIPAIGR